MENLTKSRYYIQDGRISYFANVRNCVQNPDYYQGSMMVQDGLEVTAQGKFEMLQSSIYPSSYRVPNEIFFVIKIQIHALPNLEGKVKLNKILLDIEDKSRNNQANEKHTIKVQIEKQLKD